MYPTGIQAKHYLEKLHSRYLVDQAGNVDLIEEYTIVADNESVHYWPRGIYADEDALDAPFFEDLNLRVFDKDHNREVDVLAFDNQRRTKGFLIIFLPPIKGGEKRHIRMSYSWPGFNRHLLNGQTAPYDWGAYEVSSASKLCALDVGVGFHPSIGDINCENCIPHFDAGAFTRDQDERGWLFFIYKNPAARVSDLKYRLIFSRVVGRLTAPTAVTPSM